MVSDSTGLCLEPPVGIAFIGAGKAVKVYHLPIVRSLACVQVRWVVDRGGALQAGPADGFRVSRDIEPALADPAVELVVVATPNVTHAAIARRALLAGKHVMVEKPLGLDAMEVLELAALSRERGLVLTAHHNRRHDADFLTVKSVIASGILGKVRHFESRFERFRPLAAPERGELPPGSGLCWEIGPHLIDQTLQLFGMPDAVEASLRTVRPGALADDAMDLFLSFGTLRVHLHAGMLARERGDRFVVHGTNGSFRRHCYDPQETALKAGMEPAAVPDWGAEPPETRGSLIIDGQTGRQPVPPQTGDYRRLYRNVCGAVRGRCALDVTADQAAAVVRIIGAARESSGRGTRVELDWSGWQLRI